MRKAGGLYGRAMYMSDGVTDSAGDEDQLEAMSTSFDGLVIQGGLKTRWRDHEPSTDAMYLCTSERSRKVSQRE